MWKQVLPLFVIAVLFGWFMPVSMAPELQAGANKTVETDKPLPRLVTMPPVQQKHNLPAMPGDEVVLDRQGDGHFYAETSTNGQPVRYLVDTGASVVALTAGDAQRLGLIWNYNELQHVGRGANGAVMGKPVQINELRIGGLVAQNVRAVIIPDGLDVSLLGQSFLSGVGHVAISGNRMTLRN